MMHVAILQSTMLWVRQSPLVPLLTFEASFGTTSVNYIWPHGRLALWFDPWFMLWRKNRRWYRGRRPSGSGVHPMPSQRPVLYALFQDAEMQAVMNPRPTSYSQNCTSFGRKDMNISYLSYHVWPCRLWSHLHQRLEELQSTLIEFIKCRL